MNLKKPLMSLLCVLLILFSLSIPVMASEEKPTERNPREVEDIRTYTEMPLTEEQIKELLENTPPTNPIAFEELSKNEKTIAIYGEVPSKTGEDAYDWWVSIQEITTAILEDQAFGKYSPKQGGPIRAYSCEVAGFITVYLDYDRKDEIKSDDIESMKKIIEEYAQKEGVEKVPMIFVYTSGPSKLQLDANFTDKVRPIRGGYKMESYLGTVLNPNGSTSVNNPDGTIGFPVYQNNSSSSKGFVTAGHTFRYTSAPSYQPTYNANNSNRVGTSVIFGKRNVTIHNVTINVPRLDTAYVPVNSTVNVTPIIFVGNDPVLKNSYPKRSSDNKTQMVVYGSSNSYNGEIRWYGGTSGNNGGYIIKNLYEYSYLELNDTNASNISSLPFVFDTITIMNVSTGSSCSASGDSGGPVYAGMNVTISGKTDYQAFVLGTVVGHMPANIGNSTDPWYFSHDATFYAPRGEIEYYLGVKPLTSQSMILT
ncbi:hypothetical protein [Methanolapillus ohkumae]|uniref:Protease n=1 Tax=Methanolapillus ohkumae TaxID=3028298 RepID=A0AA96ZWR1_9EURY|nr:hypothetical protein MsAm2_06370 [Methanosarcinaceae archaeon Am2]